ncbi:hypothetical protein L7F22_018328 [Adiantum nelumboides]|nr:hypothetical protein [Adiantum nelumboides]
MAWKFSSYHPFSTTPTHHSFAFPIRRGIGSLDTIFGSYTSGRHGSHREPLPPKMLYYTDQFMTILEDGFIQRPRYMDVYMPHSARVAIGQLRVSSHRLEIDAGRAAHIPREHRICRICRAEVESEEHYVCSCQSYHGIRSHYIALFSGQPTLRELMESRDQRQLGRFLLRFRDI